MRSRSLLTRAARAWVVSVVTCACLLAAWVFVAQARVGRWAPLWHNMLNVTVAFGAMFAITAALVHVPFFAVGTRTRRGPGRAEAIALGGVLGPVALVMVAFVFREAEDPATLHEWMRYWGVQWREFLVGALPFVGAGAAFGYAWWAKNRDGEVYSRSRADNRGGNRISPKDGSMSSIRDTAEQFFDACETGKGWAACQQYCHPGATFSAQAAALAGVETLEGYTEWMKGLFTPVPDGRYEVRSFAVDEQRNNVAAFAIFRGTHTAEGGPVPPTGKQVEADYVYVMQFDGDRIRHMTKIWNDGVSLKQLGWM